MNEKCFRTLHPSVFIFLKVAQGGHNFNSDWRALDRPSAFDDDDAMYELCTSGDGYKNVSTILI